mmetsp:Transcript_17598/g.40898  ORF Transcript_17598/g.40898 Transcript_17598/m.40898 type:complete len:420 (-) Transcript_17598:134-1393(-)|eukprot:CAMPEP_0178443860 /NCGR_PEP_ID=MMETSP0689_2-20121128/39147_1 /TAXON_ID=160604 /ORGANISM="Amphidinium massartii, Strain CS-259" /LENGTH=419 /DNA_ID=CAMNT_0020067949 /DNA_START=64 /DNA_END=1323 /DNA_ORIENTATION=-
MRQLHRSERHSGTGVLPSVPVVLHIYDLAKNETVQGVNSVLRAMGAGAFHAGVEVNGVEWSYGCQDQPDGSGVFQCPPRGCTDHHYRESLAMGMTYRTPEEVANLLGMMRLVWLAGKYDVLHHNCCHFCDEFCKGLGVDGLPFWVSLNIAGVGASLRRMVKQTKWSASLVDNVVGNAIGIDPGFGDGPDSMAQMAPRKSGSLLDPRVGPHIVARGVDDGSGGWCHMGSEVDVFSNSTQAWCRARVEGIQMGIALLGYQPPGVHEDTWVWKEVAVTDPTLRAPVDPVEENMSPSRSWPSQAPAPVASFSPARQQSAGPVSAIMPDWVAPAPAPSPSSSLQQYAEGDPVEVFSNSLQMWCSGYVTHISGEMVGVAFFWPGSDEPASKELHKDHGDLRHGPASAVPPVAAPPRQQRSRRLLA